MIVRLLLIGLVVAILFVAAVLVAAAVTGRDRRAYRVLRPADTVILGGQPMTIVELASRYRPYVYLRETTPSPPLLWVWYEAIPRGNHIDLVYYFNWKDEVNPNPAIHRLYSVFRAAYYGFPLYDIEYFQVGIDTRDSSISRVRFETSDGNDFYQPFPTHITVIGERRADGEFVVSQISDSGEVLSGPRPSRAGPNGVRLRVGIQTWNHLSQLLTEEEVRHGFLRIPEAEAPLRYLSDGDYRRFKFVRKSQGDHRTRQNPRSAIVAILAVAIFVILPIRLIRFAARRARN